MNEPEVVHLQGERLCRHCEGSGQAACPLHRNELPSSPAKGLFQQLRTTWKEAP